MGQGRWPSFHNQWLDKIPFDSYGNIKVTSRTVRKLIWQNDTDFGKGTDTNTVTEGIADAAKIWLDDEIDLDDDIDFTTAGDYTVSDGTKIEVASGQAQLKASTPCSNDWPFTTAGNYTYDAGKIEVTGGVAQLLATSKMPYAWWHLNESSGSTASDSSGNSRDGTLVNMEDGDWGSGKLNNGLTFDGVAEYINAGDIANFERTDSFSFEMWFKTSTTSVDVLIDRYSSNRGWSIYLDSGKVTVVLSNTVGNYIKKETDSAYNNGAWRHLVVTYDGSSTAGGVIIYIDSQVVATTTISNTLTGTIKNAVVGCSIASRQTALYYEGELDEIVIYEYELQQADVTVRYNSGSGTEDILDIYPDDDPDIYPDTGFVFSAMLSSFTETATKPSGTAIKYQISSDDGTTWKWWNGAAWTAISGGQTDSWYYTNESNSATDVSTNIASLAGSGTFRFRAFLHSDDGSARPLLDNICVAQSVTYSTDDNLYVETKDASQIDTSDVLAFLTATITNSKPSNTDIRILFSNDGRSSWLTWSGSAWVAPSSATTRTDATSITDAQTNIASLPVGSNDTLDIRIFLYTSDSSVRPTVSNVNVTGDKGYKTSGNWESNIVDSGNLSQDWGKVYFTIEIPSGTTVTIQAKASNKSDLSDTSYGSAFSDGEESNLTGQYIQFKVTFTGTTTARASCDDVAIAYQTNEYQEVAP